MFLVRVVVEGQKERPFEEYLFLKIHHTCPRAYAHPS
jgi:hypothetical protein